MGTDRSHAILDLLSTIAKCVAAILVLWEAGCTHVQLRNNTIGQAHTLSDIYQQQVIDNLALFIYDPGALPHFAFANQGTSTVTDTGTLGITNGWQRQAGLQFLYQSTGVNPMLQRNAQEAWTLTPVNDPRKLELMRCAYQKAVQICGRVAPSPRCPDCDRRFRDFYTGTQEAKQLDVDETGKTTPDCFSTNCWLAWGCKKCAPKGKCGYVGHYCGTYVWLLPGGRDELAKLTLAILDFAVHDSPAPRTKKITWSVDEKGQPAVSGKAVGQVEANIPYGELPENILSDPYVRELSKIVTEYGLNRAVFLDTTTGGGWIDDLSAAVQDGRIDEARAEKLAKQIDWLRARLTTGRPFVEGQLSPQSRFYPAEQSSLQSPGLLQFQQRLNTLPPKTF